MSFNCYLPYPENQRIHTVDSYLNLLSWPLSCLLLSKGKLSSLLCIKGKALDCLKLFVSSSSSSVSIVMDFKVVLTHGSGSFAMSDKPVPTPPIDPSLEDLPTMEEENLSCCESYARLYLIGKVLGESVPLKSIFRRVLFYGPRKRLLSC